MRRKVLRFWRWATTVNSAISLVERFIWVAIVTGVPTGILGIAVDDPWRFLTIGVVAGWVLMVLAVVVAKRRLGKALAASVEVGVSPKSALSAEVPYRPTPKAVVHRYPPGILEKPERYRAGDIAAFCKERADLARAGDALYVELYKVRIDASPKDDLAWRSKFQPWLEACKRHHQRFWLENYDPRLRARTQTTIPPWRGMHQDTIQKRLQWLREYGWGCDE